jgi:hypothetical protein
MSNKTRKRIEPPVLEVGGLARTALRLIGLGLLIAILVLLVQHKNEMHTQAVTNSLGQGVNVPDALQQILTLLNISINNTNNDHTTIINMLQGLQNSSNNMTSLLLLIQNDTATCNLLLQQLQGNITTLNTLLLLVDGNITQLNLLMQSVKNDTTLLIQMLQQHGTDTLRWLIGTEDVNGTWCNDYESCTSNILMPDSTCRYPQKSKNSSCFAEDVCHFHPPSVNESLFYCDTEASPQGVCRTTQSDALCKGWCSNSSTVNTECRPQFPLVNSTFMPVTLSFTCIAHSCMAHFSFAHVSIGLSGGDTPNCDFKFNTSIEMPPASNNTEYLDHCIQGLLIGGGYGAYIGCSYRYKCAEPLFTISGASVAATEDKVCVPIDPENPQAYEEIDAVSFFGPMRKTPTAAQYTQMIHEYHTQVWGQPDCPARRRRDANNPPPPRTLNPNVTPAP